MAEAAGLPQRGRPLRRWIVVAGAGWLAACSTVVPRAPVERPQPAARVPVPARPAAGVDTSVIQDQARNRVALLVPLTGANAAVGQSIANATQLALLDTRSEKVRVSTYDTAAAGANAAASRAIAEGAQLILGPLLADDVRAAAPVAHAAGVPMVSFSNDAGVAGGGTYLLGYAPAQSVDRVVGYARAHGVGNFGGLVPAGTYGQRASTALLRSVEAAGGKVIALQTYDAQTGGIAGAAGRLGRTAPYDGVLVAGGGRTASGAVAILRRGSPATHLMGTELWNAENGLGAIPALSGAWYAAVSDTLYRQYVTRYRSRFGSGPYRLSSLGYDAVLLTVRIARDWPVGSRFPEDRLRDRGGFSGIDGAFRFGRDGVAERALEVKEVRAGTVLVVSPAPSGFEGR